MQVTDEEERAAAIERQKTYRQERAENLAKLKAQSQDEPIEPAPDPAPSVDPEAAWPKE